MKYKVIEKRIIDKQASLVKQKKELTNVPVSLTRKSFNELQEDIVVNHSQLEEDYKLKATDDTSKYTLRTPSASIIAEITID